MDSSGPTLSLPPLLVPFPISLSAIGIPSLDTIPGSAVPTPTISESEETREDVQLDDQSGASTKTAPSEYLTPTDLGSRRASIVGSYFPSAVAGPSRISLSPSRASTPGERPKPAQLAIPLATPDEPLFSAYPNQGISRSNSTKGKGKFAFPLEPAFTLSHPPQRKKSDDGATSATTSGESSPSLGSRPVVGRRRASTFSVSPPVTAPPTRLKPAQTPPRPPKSRRRRLSLGGHGNDYHPESQWPSMPREVAKRFDSRQNHLPYSYQHPAESEYTLQSVSTIATVRPLSASPHISPRKSSLATPSSRVLLGLTNVSNPDVQNQVEIVIPDGMVMPHHPPARRSSLDYGSAVRLDIEPKYIEPERPLVTTDVRSILSASLTGTDTSASAEFSTTSPSSKEHPLSSATTSLSRSAKSSKEGGSDEKDAALTAIRLQRSLEWEAKQTRHRRQLEKRRMILLELVETEVAYTEDLKTLVQVYLPQLCALPSVSERTADLVARNSRDLLDIHLRFSRKMVDVLKEEHLGYEPQHPEPMMCKQLERVSRRLAEIFVDEASTFSAYNEFCSGSIAAATLVRHVSQKPEYVPYERRCQIISASQPHSTLRDLLSTESASDSSHDPSTAPSSPIASGGNRSRLHFRDFLIMPIQRICRYPLLLNQLLSAATSPSPDENEPEDTDGDYDTGVDVERALGAMRGVAEEADEARRVRENEIKSATVVERLETHHALSPAFLKSLGTCRLIGSLDVLHHHPTVAPLVPPVKVKYLGAFLYKGYLILAKVKKGKVYEAKHFLPLEVFELIDITEGFLPHSIRLTLREHNFDLAASCETEKEVWASALCQARDESTVPPFELPASVSPFAARARRMSAAVQPDITLPTSPTLPNFQTNTFSDAVSKRHTLAVGPGELEFPLPPARHEPLNDVTPATSPTRTSFGFTPDRRPGQPSTILLRRASATQRLIVDRALIDVFSESCSTARSKAQLHHTLFLPDDSHGSSREATMLRRRRSFLDAKQPSFDIAFSGEIKGNVMPIRQTRSLAGKRRSHPAPARFSIGGNESSTEVDGRAAYESADETATASDFGTLTRHAGYSRAQSNASASRAPSPGPLPSRQSAPGIMSNTIGALSKRRSMTNMRKSIDTMTTDSTTTLANMLNRRKTASTVNLGKRPATPTRAKSMPVSPVHSPITEVPPLPPLPSGAFATKRPSLSAHASPARRPTLFGPTSSEEDVPVFSHGAGYTNQLPPETVRSPWSSIRRSMSFIRDNNGHDGGGVFGGSMRGRPSMTRNDTDDGFEAGASSAGFSDPMSLSMEDEESPIQSTRGLVGEVSGGGGGEIDTTPKRRKSVRIFQSLSRFTPI